MSTITLAEPVNMLLRELSNKNAQDIIKDYVMTEILCKISDFSQECTHFYQKYGQRLEEYKVEYEAGDEHFERYDDLMAWEFAEQGKAYWETQLERLKHVL